MQRSLMMNIVTLGCHAMMRRLMSDLSCGAPETKEPIFLMQVRRRAAAEPMALAVQPGRGDGGAAAAAPCGRPHAQAARAAGRRPAPAGRAGAFTGLLCLLPYYNPRHQYVIEILVKLRRLGAQVVLPEVLG